MDSSSDRGQPGRPRLIETQEFKDAVAAAVQEQMAEIKAEFAKLRPAGAANEGDGKWMQQLALAIAEMSAQGSGRAPVDPAILNAREEGKKRMRQVLIECRAAGALPTYRLRHKVQLNLGDKLGEAVIDPMWIGNDHIHYPREIGYNGVPNLAMVPLDDWAKRIFHEFEVWVGNTAETAGEDWEPAQSAPDQLTQQLALTPGGVAVSGRAAATIINVGPGASRNPHAPEVAQPGNRELPIEETAVILQHQPQSKTLTNILGTIQPPAEQNA